MMMINTAYSKNQEFKIKKFKRSTQERSIFFRPHIDIHVEPRIAVQCHL